LKKNITSDHQAGKVDESSERLNTL